MCSHGREGIFWSLTELVQHLPQWNLYGSQRVLLKWLMVLLKWLPHLRACIVQQENVPKIMVSLCLEPYFWKKKKCALCDG